VYANRMGDLATVTLAAVGFVASARDGTASLAALFAAVAVIAAVRMLRERGERPVAVRRDLSVWLEEVAAATGEPPGVIVDRAVSEHRASRRGGSDAAR
jgi:hypothetical protein